MTRRPLLFVLLSLLLAALFAADLAVGSVAVSFGDIWGALTGGACDPVSREIILKIRLLKASTALLAGMALAASGLQMQTLFRNPLAGPYVLGISSGAGLGVALFLLGAPCSVSRTTRCSSRSASQGPHGSVRPSCCSSSWPSAAASRTSWFS